ncbi:MAG: histidine kinase dimerization/phospho-acceptor domain-containing protein, partial [Bdellovibrionota bacterium]
EARLRRHDGVYRWFLVRAVPVRGAEGEVIRWFGTSTDIDDQKKTRTALEREKILREQFVNTLSHDLRNPLSAAKAGAQMALRYADRPEQIPKIAVRVAESIDRVDRMIQDLLDANRIRAGKPLPVGARGLRSASARERGGRGVDLRLR